MARMPRAVSRGAVVPFAAPQQQGYIPPLPATAPPIGTAVGNWFWDGTGWVCDPDCTGGNWAPPCPPFPQGCPPFFTPPAGVSPWYPGANGGVAFSAIAPANPTRGMFWWDGVALHLFDGAAWNTIGGAATTAGLPPNPVVGALWWNGSTLMVWNGTVWVPGTTGSTTTVSAVAPIAPNVGDGWLNGTVLSVWNGSAWVVVAAPSGAPGTASQPVFKIGTATTTTVSSPPWTIAPINGAPTVNTGGAWDATGHKYTPSKPGVYNFECLAFSLDPNPLSLVLLFNDNGAPSSSLTNQSVIALGEITGPSWVNCNGMVQMNGTTDFVRLWWASTLAGTINPGPGMFSSTQAAISNIQAFLIT